MNQEARGCFGAATVYAADSEACKQCETYQACGLESIKTLKRISSVVNVEDLIARHQKAKAAATKTLLSKDKKAIEEAPPGPVDTPTPTKPVARAVPVENVTFEVSEKHAQIIANLPVKARSFTTSLCRRGLLMGIRTNVAQRDANFHKAIPLWLSIPLVQLVKNGEITAESIRAEYEEKLQWTKGTMASHISLVFSFLEGFEIATKEAKRYVISPTLAA